MNRYEVATCDRISAKTFDCCDEPATHVAHDGRAVLLCREHAIEATVRGVRVVAIPQPICSTVVTFGGCR